MPKTIDVDIRDDENLPVRFFKIRQLGIDLIVGRSYMNDGSTKIEAICSGMDAKVLIHILNPILPYL
jgi:hypothetical protein